MANFHEKVLCLFHKDYKQLKKEADRRGLDYDTREKTIANIIWKDAYDVGIVEGRNQAIYSARNCPANCCGNAKPEVREYCLHDIGDDYKYRLELTEDQVRIIEWMIGNEFLLDIVLSEWNDTFEDVGRI